MYEEQGGDTRAQCASLTLLIGTMEKISCFGEENHSTLRQSLAQAATRLVKRPDQVRTLLLCTHLFWSARRIDENSQKSEPVNEIDHREIVENHFLSMFSYVTVKKSLHV